MYQKSLEASPSTKEDMVIVTFQETAIIPKAQLHKLAEFHKIKLKEKSGGRFVGIGDSTTKLAIV